MLKEIGKSILEWGMEKSPKILAGIGIGGVVVTAVMAAKAAPKANEKIAEIEWEETDREIEKIVKTVKAAAPVYAPTVAMGTLTIASFLGSQRIMSTRQAMATIFASASETALKEYQDVMMEKLGRSKHEKVMTAIAQKRLPDIIEANEGKELPGDGDVLFADCQTGRMFRSSIEQVRKAEADVAKLMNSQMVVSLNDFYEMIGLRDVDLGDKNGWILDRGDQFEIFFTYEADPMTEKPITIINYDVSYLGRY